MSASFVRLYGHYAHHVLIEVIERMQFLRLNHQLAGSMSLLPVFRHMLLYTEAWVSRVRLDVQRSDSDIIMAALVQLTLDFGAAHAGEIQRLWMQLACKDDNVHTAVSLLLQALVDKNTVQLV